jgi:predicted peptidase
MLFLHGRGECMVHPQNGEQLLEIVATHGPPSQDARALDQYFTVVSPQCRYPPNWNINDLRLLLNHFAANAAHYQVDPQRVVLAGISMGADGAWNLVTSGQSRNRLAGEGPDFCQLVRAGRPS